MHLPEARGPLSEWLLGTLRGGAPSAPTWPAPSDALSDEDLQLSLYVGYELHYRGFDGVPDECEWDPRVIWFRSRLEHRFESALRAGSRRRSPADSMEESLRRIIEEEEGPSLSEYLERYGDMGQYREFIVHRSAYQLKEADPHSWAIPRLDGAAKAALMAIQFEEYGSGEHTSMHAELFRRTMRAVGLDDGYGAYLDHIPAATLATVNLMSLFGLHRRLRGALVGHLATFEMTSTEPNARYAAGLRRIGAPDDAIGFYDEHVEADADHEIVAATGLAGGLVDAEPQLVADVLFGSAALLALETRFARHVLDAWAQGRSSLRRPLDEERGDGATELRSAATVAGRY